MVAPCLYGEGTEESLVNDYSALYKAGIYKIGGPDLAET